jgi:hypothetical protein
MRTAALLLFVCLALLVPRSRAAGLEQPTIAAFDQYARTVEQRVGARVQPGAKFLWVDDVRDRQERVRRGDIVVEPAADTGQIRVSDGLIHDWIGAVFIPGASIEQALAVIQDYDRYKDFYKPGLVASRLTYRKGEDEKFELRIRRTEFVDVTIDVALDGKQTCSQGRCYGFSRSTRIQEVRDAGKAGEYKLPPGKDRGLLWRLNGYTRLQQRDGGVYLEVESLVLTRSVPALIAWFVQPIIRQVSRESMADALRMTREAVLRRMR